MRWFTFALTLALSLSVARPASAQVIFGTNSRANQSITSPIFGGAVGISATGVQNFTVNPTGTIHFAGAFSGTVDFDPNPLSNSDLTVLPSRTWSFQVRLTQN